MLNFELLLQDKKGSTRIYNIFTSSKKVHYKFIHKWDVKLNVDISIPKWMVFCCTPFTSTLDTKVRWFQYRLVHRILGVNPFLAKIKIKNSDLCTFCQEESEILVHLFCTRRITCSCWNQIKMLITETTNINVNFDNACILFGVLNRNWNTLNLILTSILS